MTSNQSDDDQRDNALMRATESVRRSSLQASEWLTHRRAVNMPVDVGVRIYERDRSQFGSVLGSALAFRLTLFILSLSILGVGLGKLLVNANLLDEEFAEGLGLTGTLAIEVDEAFQGSQTSAWLLLFSGLIGTLWAGRNLAATLAAVSSATWGLPRRPRLATIRIVGATIGLMVLLVVSTSILETIRRANGLAIATGSLAIVLAVYTASWFLLTLTLPRATPDPGAVLPGAALVGVALTLMHGTTQLYLAPRLDAKSELIGGIGVSAVAMGWFFFISRVMVASLSVNAVVYEQLGSLSQVIFDLPGLRRIPRRFPSVVRFFDLHVAPDPEAAADDESS